MSSDTRSSRWAGIRNKRQTRRLESKEAISADNVSESGHQTNSASVLSTIRQRFFQSHQNELAIFRRLFIGPSELTQTFFLSRWFFLRSLGFCYLFAFASLTVQIDGLIGSNGILPAKDYVEAIWNQLGIVGYWTFPTLCWISADDTFLHFLGNGGIFLSILLILGILPTPSLIGLWTFYLSLSTVSRVFLGFQWDTCILEVGFLAIFLAPAQFLPRLSRERKPSRIVMWLHYWLLFRLMLSAGLVKLTSNDITWRKLTALNFHYETQPIPNFIAWYAHQLPEWFQKLSVLGTFGIELFLPIFILAPRRLRIMAALGTGVLMVLIMCTGNYCFFNILVLALCFLLIDDHFYRHFLPHRLFRIPEHPRPRSVTNLVLSIVIAVIIVPVSMIQMKSRVFRLELTPAETRVYRWLAPYRSINSYGLFASMTTSRPEIIIEGSDNRKDWEVYEFKWKPGRLDRPPSQVAPHQPRVDWQMWFEGLNYLRGGQPSEWFKRFLICLLEGKPEVLALIEHNPYPDSPPTYIRAVIYDYHFTNAREYDKNGNWWKRTYKGIYVYPSKLPEQ